MSEYVSQDGEKLSDPEWVSPEGGAIAAFAELLAGLKLTDPETHNFQVAGHRLMAPFVRIATALERIAVALEARPVDTGEFERGRVAGLRSAVTIQEWGGGWVAISPSVGLGTSRMLRSGAWVSGGGQSYFPTRDAARAAVDAAPNWWEAVQ